jgi:hypothetical protein
MSYNALYAEASAYWSLQSTSITDEKTLVNATVTAGASTTTGPRDYLPVAVNLTGGRTINFNRNLRPAGTGGLTLAYWVNRQTPSNEPFEAVENGCWAMAYALSSRPGFTIYHGAETNTNITTGSGWNHVTMSLVYGSANPGGRNLYINGDIRFTTIGTPFSYSPLAGATNQFILGGHNTNTTWRTNSFYAGVAAWPRILSGAEITDWYAGPEPINNTAPVIQESPTVPGRLVLTSVGNWDARNNGAISYFISWFRGTTLLQSGSSTFYDMQPADFSSPIIAYVNASNNGGFDLSQQAASNAFVPGGFGSLRHTLTASPVSSQARVGKKANLNKSLADVSVNSTAKTDFVSVNVQLNDATVFASALPNSGKVNAVLDSASALSSANRFWTPVNGLVRANVFQTLQDATVFTKNYRRRVRNGLFVEGGMSMELHQANM